MVRYRKLGYVEMNVSDLQRSRAFYADIVGLEYLGAQDGAERFRCDADEPYSVVLHQSGAPGFKRAGWELEDESQFEVLQGRLDATGCPWARVGARECASRGLDRAIRMVEPNCRATLEFYARREPKQARPPRLTHTKIERLGHVVWQTPRRADAVRFFREVLNFRESDAIDERVTFMRPFPTPWHHGIGIARSDRPRFHHLNFMVTEIDDIGKALNRARRHEVPVVFGPGRHLASGSVFLYFLDPDGTTLEYSFGMEQFPEHDPREPQVLPPVPESLDTWGAFRDPRMSAHGENEVADIGAAEAASHNEDTK